MQVRVPSNGAALLPVVAPQDSLGVLFFVFVLLGFCIARPMALRGSRFFLCYAVVVWWSSWFWWSCVDGRGRGCGGCVCMCLCVCVCVCVCVHTCVSRCACVSVRA